MPIVKVSAKGWVVIPKELRKKYGIKPGSRVSFLELGKTIYVVPIPEDPVAAAYGMLKDDDGRTWTDEIVEEHRLAREREDADMPSWADGGGDTK